MDTRYCSICGSEYDAQDLPQRGEHGNGCWKCDPKPDMLEYANPDCMRVYIEANPIETISALAEITGIGYDTLAKAAREGRIIARQSGSVWLTTRAAIEYALQTGKIRPRKETNMNIIHYVTCPQCGNHVKDFHAKAGGKEYWDCDNCGHEWPITPQDYLEMED